MSSGADAAAVVLAGGAGTRVGGRDKGLLERHGATLVAHSLRRLVEAGFTEIVVSANRNVDIYARMGWPVIADEDPATFLGPLAGIARTLAAVRAQRLFTVPVDATDWPLDLPGLLAARLDSARAACAVVRVGAQREPLFALYRTSCAEEASESVSRRELAVRDFQDRIGCVELELPPSMAFANLNTSEALAGARA